jgi:hypothetical protein
MTQNIVIFYFYGFGIILGLKLLAIFWEENLGVFNPENKQINTK